MAALILDYDVINDTPANAQPVEANFNRVQQFCNQDLVNRDGSTAMVGPLKLNADPAQPLEAATKQYVDALLPIGMMMPYGGAAAPPGGRWMLCDGSELEIAAYPELFAAIGTSYGGSAGRFKLPNTQGRTPIGVDPTADSGLSLGTAGGTRNIALPEHDHSIDHTHAGGVTGWHNQDHSHRVSGSTGGQSASHYHVPNTGHNDYLMGDHGGPAGSLYVGGAGGQPYANAASTNWTSNDHTHYFDQWSSGMNVAHDHNFQTPAHTGRSGMTGTKEPATGVGNNLPPFVVVSYIMRVK